MVKIAVIEDDLPIQQMYELKLKKVGFDVRTANDGVEGLRLAESFKPDLMLLDIRMPNMSGDDMLKQMREQEWGKDILVIVLTNISQNEIPMQLRLLRVEQYIVKAHSTPQQVLDSVMQTLERYNKLPPELIADHGKIA